MALLLLLCLTLACLPLDWPAPPFGLDPAGSAALTASVVVVMLVLARLSSWATVGQAVRQPLEREAVARAHSLRRLIFVLLNLAAFAFALLWCGWGWAVGRMLTLEGGMLVPGAELLVLAPYLITLIGSWATFYDAERAIHFTGTASSTGGEFWTRWGYVSFLFRYHTLMVFLPVLFTVSQFGLLRVEPGLFDGPWSKIVAFAGLFGFILLIPSAVPLVLGLRRMPAGALRDQIEKSAGRLGVRYRNLYVWNTRGSLATAMVSGLIPRFRHIVFTDLLLTRLTEDEVQSVFGHEVGHVKHRHLLYYAAFLILSFLTLGAVYQAVELVPIVSSLRKDAIMVLSVVGTGAYLFLAFGFVSRRCERQADVFGCKAVSCAEPNCKGHTKETTLVAGGKSLCRTGVATFVSALERVEEVNGMARGTIASARRGLFGRMASVLRFVGVCLGTWQHGTIARRVAFLKTLADDQRRERRFQVRVTALRWGLFLLLVSAVVAMAAWNGWRTILEVV